MDLDTAHAAASQIFVDFGLSYWFISKLIPRAEADPAVGGSSSSSSSRPPADVAAAVLTAEDVSAGWAHVAGAHENLICFSFSKPTNSDPRPAIVVEMFVEVIAHNAATDSWRYLARAEGQRYSRYFEVRGGGREGAVGGGQNVFSEAWIDKVYAQKEAILGKRLWVK